RRRARSREARETRGRGRAAVAAGPRADRDRYPPDHPAGEGLLPAVPCSGHFHDQHHSGQRARHEGRRNSEIRWDAERLLRGSRRQARQLPQDAVLYVPLPVPVELTRDRVRRHTIVARTAAISSTAIKTATKGPRRCDGATASLERSRKVTLRSSTTE